MKYLNKNIKLYLRDLSRNTPAPGGGSAAAVGACLGVSLLLMVANFTLGKKGYEKAQSTICNIIEKLSNCKKSLESLIDDDIKAYSKVSKILKMKKSAKREKMLEIALRESALVPFEVCKLSHICLKEAPILLKKGNKNLLTDVICGTYFLKSAFASAKVNVCINLKYIKDKKFVRLIRGKLKKWQNY